MQWLIFNSISNIPGDNFHFYCLLYLFRPSINLIFFSGTNKILFLLLLFQMLQNLQHPEKWISTIICTYHIFTDISLYHFVSLSHINKKFLRQVPVPWYFFSFLLFVDLASCLILSIIATKRHFPIRLGKRPRSIRQFRSSHPDKVIVLDKPQKPKMLLWLYVIILA